LGKTQKQTTMNTYKFRAECSTDAILFFRKLKEDDFGCIQIYSNPNTSDIEVVFNSKNDIEYLMHTADNCLDCHVITQTIQPIEEYTGERKNIKIKIA
jgi:hypothetical protein